EERCADVLLQQLPTGALGYAAGAGLAIQDLGPVSVVAIHRDSPRALLHAPYCWRLPMKWLSHTGTKALQAGSYRLQLFGLPTLRIHPGHLGGRWLSGIGSVPGLAGYWAQ